ncbi:MAG: GGDEF domain-containing protein [Bacilli bacterium]|nr:GGDEF domain-containing protein [Bacilli bacterium]
MKKKLLIIPIIIAALAFIFVYRYYNHEDKSTTLTVSEKKWVQDNSRKTIDIEVVNDYPIYGMDGKGVFYDFVDDFSKNVGLDFNKIPYLKESETTTDSLRFQILDNDQKLTKNDLLLFEDYYIAIGKNYDRINRIKDIKDVTFGIFDQDAETLKYYLKSATGISYKTYKNIGEIYQALDKNQVNMIIIPNVMYMDKNISSDQYSINYYFTEITKKVVLTLTNNNEELNNIVKKYYTKWKETKFIERYDKEYFDYYIKENNLTSKEKASLVSKVYTYGYVDNKPYETKKNGKVVGIAGEYINRVSRLSDIEFKYKKYSSKKKLEEAINNKEIDIYFDYYGINNKDYTATISTFIEDYVILGRRENNYIINSFESIRNKEVAMLGDNSLYNYVNSNAKASIKTYDNISELVDKAQDRIIIVDRNIYDEYQKSKFKNYNVLYIDTMMNDYKFMVKSSNKTFYNLVNYIINTNSYYNYKNSGLDMLNRSFLEERSFEQIYIVILIIIFLPIIIAIMIYFMFKKKKEKKKVIITDKQKYIDILTSLKNRNYLNTKMPEWESSKVFPQAIVIIDLNNVKYVNDNYGHEEGDQLIVEAAGILVNTQLENSEIIRTDGNEFLIYLVGYSERQISTYTKKLSKELKKLPHEFGAGVGFSMITDEIKTLDDAINEATLEMVTDKEEYNKG